MELVLQSGCDDADDAAVPAIGFLTGDDDEGRRVSALQLGQRLCLEASLYSPSVPVQGVDLLRQRLGPRGIPAVEQLYDERSVGEPPGGIDPGTELEADVRRSDDVGARDGQQGL